MQKVKLLRYTPEGEKLTLQLLNYAILPLELRK